ncbi:MAG: hypothetical protein IKZ29_09340 [Clostridiales bacterium]|nr:hypothetical protein [Clostridiales bacterium]
MKEYEKIAGLFYEKAAERVKQKVTESGLKHTEIYPPDHKQISRIINNNRQKNNPYLISNAVLKSFYIDEGGDHIPCGLVEKLDFESVKEVLWGSDKEIESYIHELFNLLWEEVCVQEHQIDAELYLSDYIPYAKYSTYWDLLFNNNTSGILHVSPADDEAKKVVLTAISTFGIYEDTVIELIDPARKEALLFLYSKCHEDFLSKFLEFANNTDSYHSLNKTIKNVLVNGIFIPLLEKHKPDASSLGLRVRNLIKEDLSYSAALIFNTQIDNPKYRHQLIRASSEYICKLEKIQRQQVNFLSPCYP